jgi:hypothetical protein
MGAVITALEAALGADVVLTGADIAERAPWSGNGEGDSAPAVIKPRTPEQVATALRICHAHRQAIVPQGGLTGLVKATVTNAHTLALSLERLNRIEAVDPVNRTMTVQAGVPLQAVQERADQVMRHGPGSGDFFDLEGDGVRFVDSHPDGQNALSVDVLENHDGHVRNRVHHESANFHFDFHYRPLSAT